MVKTRTVFLRYLMDKETENKQTDIKKTAKDFLKDKNAALMEVVIDPEDTVKYASK